MTRLLLPVLTGILTVLCAPAYAAIPQDLLTAKYAAYTTDINNDGCPDMLVKAPDVIVLLDLDDIALPIPVPPPQRSFLIRSQFTATPRTCNYALVQDPGRDVTTDSRWQLMPNGLAIGDVLGTGSGSFLIGPLAVAADNQQVLFSVARTSGGFTLLQSLGGRSYGFNDGTNLYQLGYANDDTRTDLLIRLADGNIKVYSADPNGLFSSSTVDNDSARITFLWKDFLSALSTGSIDEVLSRVAVSQRDRFRAAYVDGGMTPSTPSTLPSLVTRFAVQEVTENWARAAFVVKENGVDQGFFIIFSEDDDGVWRLYSM